MSAQFTLIAKLTAKPETAEELGRRLEGLIASTRGEPGSIAYLLHRDNDNPDIWVLYETWRSRADLDAHFQQPYTKEVMARFPELLAKDMELTFCTLIAPQS
jgi:quinol monooxygenase YgiN